MMIVKGARFNKNLQVLDVAHNPIGRQGGTSLMMASSASPSLHFLGLQARGMREREREREKRRRARKGAREMGPISAQVRCTCTYSK
jgi:hypothetical protein